jgi:hypothetical protein
VNCVHLVSNHIQYEESDRCDLLEANFFPVSLIDQERSEAAIACIILIGLDSLACVWAIASVGHPLVSSGRVVKRSFLSIRS